MNKCYEDIKVKDMARVLKKLGFRPRRPSGGIRFYEHPENFSICLPSNPEELLLSRLVDWILGDLRLPDREFDRLRQEP